MSASWEDAIRSIVAEELARMEARREARPSTPADGEATSDAPDGDVVNADEAAAFLGLDRKTVYEYARRGAIPHQRLGRRVLFSKRALVSWLSSCKSAPHRRGRS